MKRLSTAILIILASITLSGCSLFADVESLEVPVMMEVFPPINRDVGPSAKANIKYRHVEVGEVLQFDASGSQFASHYHWQVLVTPSDSQTEFSHPDLPQSQFIIDQPGEYQLQLKVTDDNGLDDIFEIRLSTDIEDLPSSRFIVVGDFGYGSSKQYRVGEAMAQVCDEVGCDMVLSAGDNIYNTGIDSVDDPHIMSNFEKPFAPVELPFYMVLGNHDTGGIGGDGGLHVRGDIQIEYSRSKEKISYRWQMPARYYRLPVPVEQPQYQPLIDIYALDTNVLASPYDTVARYKLPRMVKQMGAWLESEKRHSKAQWQLALGHHPYLSNGKHGNAGDYRRLEEVSDSGIIDRIRGKFVKRFLGQHVCNDMSLWISGHEHNLQDLKATEGCGKTEFIVSGAGGSANAFDDANRNPVHWQQDNQLGFFHIEIVAQHLTLRAYTVDKQSGVATLQHQRSLLHH